MRKIRHNRVSSERNQNRPDIPQRKTDIKTLPFAILTVGAEGVGKTALARWIDNWLRAEGYDPQPLLNETARAVLGEHELKLQDLRVDPELTSKYQRAVFYRQLEEERRRGFKNYVADRSGADNLAYLAEYGSASGISELLESEAEAVEKYKTILRRNIVLHVTPQREIYDTAPLRDGVRAVGSWESIVRIDALVKFILRLWRVPVLYVDKANMSERTEQARTAIGLRLAR